MSNPVFTKPIGACKVFAALWVIVFAIYFPAAKAGFVADFTGWLDQMQHYGFWDNINRTHYRGHSLYQFTQLNSWVFFQLFGTHPWLWHLLSVTLHVVNATLLYRLCSGLLQDAGVKNAPGIALAGAVLFCLTPGIAEVVVWESSYHYLQGLLLTLLVLNWVRRYALTGGRRYIWLAALIFFLSTFSLEIFYLTPWLVAAMALYYRLLVPGRTTAGRKIFLYFFIPQLLLFFLHLCIFHMVYGQWVAHDIGASMTAATSQLGFGKPLKHIFHILFLGRFFSDRFRHTVYTCCDSTVGITFFYTLVAIACLWIIVRVRALSARGGIVALLFVFVMVNLAFLIPLWFHDMFLVVYDRYTYFTAPFLFMLVSVLVSCISLQAIRSAIFTIYALVNLRFAVQVSRYWMKSEHIVTNLLRTFPFDSNKTIIMLNLPQNMHGVAMIGAEKESEFALMHDGLLPAQKIRTTVYDAMAYNMLTPLDGAHVRVLNDSDVEVTLNQWGTWWWFAMQGGGSCRNSAYSINMKDIGRCYMLTLKKPAAGYLLLYNVGDRWKVVDMNLKNVDQY